MIVNLIPDVYLSGEPGADLQALLRCVEDQWQGLTDEAAAFPTSTQSEFPRNEVVTSWLDHRGNPFDLSILTPEQQRTLTAFVLWMHHHRGITETIKTLAKSILNLDVIIQDGVDVAWTLGDGKLGSNTYTMGQRGSDYLLINLQSTPADPDLAMLRSITEYIKPVTHAYRIQILDGGFGIGSFGLMTFGG